MTKTTDYIVRFMQPPVWNGTTPDEGGIYVSGVHCPPLIWNFTASSGKVPLRMALTYTVLRPKAGYAFVQKDNVPPSRAEVFRNTDRQQVGGRVSRASRLE